MGDVSLLRQTIRRCTAILVVAIAIAGLSPPQASDAPLLIVLALTATLYLAGDIFRELPDDDNPGDDSEKV